MRFCICISSCACVSARELDAYKLSDGHVTALWRCVCVCVCVCVCCVVLCCVVLCCVVLCCVVLCVCVFSEPQRVATVGV